jgi:hypothetical protein
MLGRNGNIAYVRYDSQNRIVAGGPIISPYRPKNGNWQTVSDMIGTNTTGSNGNILRAFIRLDMFGRVVPSSLVIQTKEPSDANSGTGWIEINAIYRGVPTTTTTTTIAPRCINYSLLYNCPTIQGDHITIDAISIHGCASDQFYWSKYTYLSQAEAEDPGIEYLGPVTNLSTVTWDTGYEAPNNHTFWVSIKDGDGNKTVKSKTTNCASTTTTTTSSTSTSTTTTTTTINVTTTTTTTESTTINPNSPVNTIFAKYDVVPGPAQGVNTVFVKYGVQ